MRTTIIILFLLTSNNTFGQINIGPIKSVKYRSGKFEQANLDKLKSSKTIFIYRESDKENLDLVKSTLKEVWDYSELNFVSYKEYSLNKYDENYSFFTIDRERKVNVSNSGRATENIYFYLKLWMRRGDEILTFCRIELFPNFSTYQKASVRSSASSKSIMKHLYTDSQLYNWNLIFLKNYLQFVNRKLKKSDERWLYKSESSTILSHLKNETLYIPEYILIKFAKFTGDESIKHNPESLFRKYPYSYKIISIEELSNKISNSSKPLYYLSYVKSSAHKFVSVVNEKTGELLYTNYSGGYNINDKDLGKLSREIKKSGS